MWEKDVRVRIIFKISLYVSRWFLMFDIVCILVFLIFELDIFIGIGNRYILCFSYCGKYKMKNFRIFVFREFIV